MNGPYDYGYWLVAVVMSAVFVAFAFSFTRPKNWRDWRSFGAFSAFVVALFAEMYGFPLTIYLLSGWLGSRYPGLDLFAHDSGHLWQTLFGIGEGSPWAAHFNVLHVLSNVLIGGGVYMARIGRRFHDALVRSVACCFVMFLSFRCSAGIRNRLPEGRKSTPRVSKMTSRGLQGGRRERSGSLLRAARGSKKNQWPRPGASPGRKGERFQGPEGPARVAQEGPRASRRASRKPF